MPGCAARTSASSSGLSSMKTTLSAPTFHARRMRPTDSDFGPQLASTGKRLSRFSSRSERRNASSTRAGSFLLATARRTPESASACSICW